MRKLHLLTSCVVILFLFGSACRRDRSQVFESGVLKLNASVDVRMVEVDSELKSAMLAPIADDFWIYIYQEEILEDGFPLQYKELPTELELPAGDYQIYAANIRPEDVSLPTRDPAAGFLFEDEINVTITAGETSQAQLNASLSVASVEVVFESSFTDLYSDYSATIAGIIFDATNSEIVYLEAGNVLVVTLTYTDNGETITKNLETTQAIAAADAWVLSFTGSGSGVASTAGQVGFSLSVLEQETPQTASWEIVAGESGSTSSEDGTLEHPYSVETARSLQDGSKVWVQGYIVGNILGSTSVTTDYTTASDSNIAIAEVAGETDLSKMLFVELDGSTLTAREALGLSATSGTSLGYLVKLNGTLESYYSNPGLKGINTASEFVIIE